MSSPVEPKISGSNSLTRNPHPQPNSQILHLPCEVRQMVITYALPESEPIKYQVTRTHHQRVFTNTRLSISTIASICLALYKDVKAIEHRFYTQNEFHVEDLYSGYFWLERLSPKNQSAIRTLSITLEDAHYGSDMAIILPNLQTLTIDVSCFLKDLQFERHINRLEDLFQIVIHNNTLFPGIENPCNRLTFLLAMEPVQEVRVTMSKALEMVGEEKDIMLREENYERVRRLERRIRVMIVFEVIYLTQFAERLGALMKLEIGERDLRTLEGPCAEDLIRSRIDDECMRALNAHLSGA